MCAGARPSPLNREARANKSDRFTFAPTCWTPPCCCPDPQAILRFDEHRVVLPVVVIAELEAKRTHPELGYFARTALRLLDDLRLEHGRCTRRCRCPTVANSAWNSTTPTRVPCPTAYGWRATTQDLAVAANLAAEGLTS